VTVVVLEHITNVLTHLLYLLTYLIRNAVRW